jgi:hypothetical protein
MTPAGMALRRLLLSGASAKDKGRPDRVGAPFSLESGLPKPASFSLVPFQLFA